MYLLAAESTGALPNRCVAVEDNVGRRIGGECEDRSHRRLRRRVAHRLRERRGARFDVNVRRAIATTAGARISSSASSPTLVPLVKHFEETDARAPVTFPKSLIESLESKIYVDQTRVAFVETWRTRGGAIEVVARVCMKHDTRYRTPESHVLQCVSLRVGIWSAVNSCHPR